MSIFSSLMTSYNVVCRPSDGNSQHEFAVYDEYFRNKGTIYGIMVNIKASDGGNLMREDYLVGCLSSDEVKNNTSERCTQLVRLCAV